MKYYCDYKSPVGILHLVSNGSALIGLHFNDKSSASLPATDPAVMPFPKALEQLSRYFAGSLEEFDLPIVFHGTEFQIRAWNELKKIPFGATISYKAQAEKIGSVPRAVGLANGQNPIAILFRAIESSEPMVDWSDTEAGSTASAHFCNSRRR